MKPRAKQQGAALLVALLVATVAAASLLLSAFSTSSLPRAREQRTLKHLAQASDALQGFAATHGRLPRPAISADDGSEGQVPCRSEQDCSGLLPWRDLGLEAADSWGHALLYSVTPEFTVAPIARTAAIATKRVQARDSSGALYFTIGQDSCTLPAQCAPAIVLSRGASDTPGGADEANNLQASIGFIARPASTQAGAPGGAFDDLLLAVPLPELYARMTQARTLP